MDQEEAIGLVQAWLAEIGQQGFSYSIAGAREHPDVWAIAVQVYRPDGQPLYDFMGLDVDKMTGEVRQMT